jgi:hypothetical protein
MPKINSLTPKNQQLRKFKTCKNSFSWFKQTSKIKRRAWNSNLRSKKLAYKKE